MKELAHSEKITFATVKSYIFGFILSIIFTLGSYIIVLIHISSAHEIISHEILIPTIFIFAFVQLVIQLVYFLHIGKESGPRWNLVFFAATFSLVLLVVVASIWIMNHLNYNMTPADMTKYIIQQGEGF